MMQRKIKLIWDFRGQDALKTAQHHCQHLQEFSKTSTLEFFDINSHDTEDNYSIAFVIVNEEDMIQVRDALKPHRAEVAK